MLETNFFSCEKRLIPENCLGSCKRVCNVCFDLECSLRRGFLCLFFNFFYMVRSTNVPGSTTGTEEENLRIQADVRRELGMSPLLVASIPEGVRVVAASRTAHVMVEVGSSSPDTSKSAVVLPHRPNRNQVFPSGSLDQRAEACLSLGADPTRYQTH